MRFPGLRLAGEPEWGGTCHFVIPPCHFVIPPCHFVIPVRRGGGIHDDRPVREKAPFVYIMASKRNGTLYTGMTSDLVKRVWEHREAGHFVFPHAISSFPSAVAEESMTIGR